MKRLEDLTILYIDFDSEEREQYLSLFNHYFKKVFVASEDAFGVYSEQKPDIIVIELLVPKSVELVKKIRESDERVAFVALTEDSSIELLREIVELSFSSYLIKPVSKQHMQEELIKVSKRVNIRGKINLPLFCQWDIRSKTLLYHDNVIFLTNKESKLFELLVEKKGKFCSDNEILFFVWGDEFDKIVTNSSIRTLVKNLRRKVPEGLIENQYGVGYKIVV